MFDDSPRQRVSAGVFPLLNLTEDKNNYYVRAELTGVKGDELDIQVTGKNLAISGERKFAAEEEGARYHRREREAGIFSRMIGLPGEVDTDKVEANLENGISSGAKADEVKSAYRRLPKEYHPDHYAGGSERFQEIQEAYSVLGNIQRRHKYEQSIRKAPPKPPLRSALYVEPEPLIPEQRTVDLGEVSPMRSFQSFTPSFDEIFDWLWSNFSSLEQPKSGRVKNLTLEGPLTPEILHPLIY